MHVNGALLGTDVDLLRLQALADVFLNTGEDVLCGVHSRKNPVALHIDRGGHLRTGLGLPLDQAQIQKDPA